MVHIYDANIATSVAARLTSLVHGLGTPLSGCAFFCLAVVYVRGHTWQFTRLFGFWLLPAMQIVVPSQKCSGEKGHPKCFVYFYRSQLWDCVAASVYLETKQHPMYLWQPHVKCGKVRPGTKHPLPLWRCPINIIYSSLLYKHAWSNLEWFDMGQTQIHYTVMSRIYTGIRGTEWNFLCTKSPDIKKLMLLIKL